MSEIELEVKNILPLLTVEEVAKVVALLVNDIGVEEQADLQHVEISDVLSILKPVQARKLYKEWQKRSAKCVVSIDASECDTEPVSDPMSSHSSLSRSNSMDSSAASTSNINRGDDWDFNFCIPWDKFPRGLMTSCANGKRPEKRHRLEMIRILVDDVHQVVKKPKVKNMERIAFRIVSKYPDTFKDYIDGEVIGSGVESLTTQLMYRSDNLSRKNLKRLPFHMGSDNAEASTSSDDSTEKQEYLQAAYLLANKDDDKIKGYMAATFKSQRRDIDDKLLVCEIKDKWPFLFEEDYLYQHYEMLMEADEYKTKFITKLADGTEKVYRLVTMCKNLSHM